MLAGPSAVPHRSLARSPCRTFADWLGEDGWVKRFTARGDCGAYFRVIEPGLIHPGDPIELVGDPGHDITMGMAFKAKMGDAELGPYVTDAGVLPAIHQDQLVRRFRPRR